MRDAATCGWDVSLLGAFGLTACRRDHRASVTVSPEPTGWIVEVTVDGRTSALCDEQGDAVFTAPDSVLAKVGQFIRRTPLLVLAPRPKTWPRVQCWHGTERLRSSRHMLSSAPDSIAARTPEHWRERLPAGVSFALEYVEAQGARPAPLGVYYATSEAPPSAPPVAGSLPEVVKVTLPNGVIRDAMRYEVQGRTAYRLRARPSDALPGAWDGVAPRVDAVAVAK